MNSSLHFKHIFIVFINFIFKKMILQNGFSYSLFSTKFKYETYFLKMKTKDYITLKIFPIFYHVEPTEVRNQTGIYGEAFKNHQTNADEEKKITIEEWKAALRKAGELSGFPLKDR